MKDLNFGNPELQKLEEVVSQFDFILQEGIIYTKEEQDRALFLVNQLEKIISDLFIK